MRRFDYFKDKQDPISIVTVLIGILFTLRRAYEAEERVGRRISRRCRGFHQEEQGSPFREAHQKRTK